MASSNLESLFISKLAQSGHFLLFPGRSNHNHHTQNSLLKNSNRDAQSKLENHSKYIQYTWFCNFVLFLKLFFLFLHYLHVIGR